MSSEIMAVGKRIVGSQAGKGEIQSYSDWGGGSWPCREKSLPFRPGARARRGRFLPKGRECSMLDGMSLPAVYVYYRLYLKQVECNRERGVLEVAPVSFNYQNFIVVVTERIAASGGAVVVQSHSCGCGPQPLIRAGWLAGVVTWRESTLRRLMAESASVKTRQLAEQDLVPDIWRVTVNDPQALACAVRQHCGRAVTVRCFGEI